MNGRKGHEVSNTTSSGPSAVRVLIDGNEVVRAARSDRLEDDPKPAMTTIPSVTLCEVGTWQASTGEVTFTQEDLASMMAALDDPAIKPPRLRFGHTSWDTNFAQSQGYMDEQPNVGKFTNLRYGENNNSIVGDLVGVPTWLAEVLPVAYPNRSVEVYWDVETPTGNQYKAALASVAVLGIHLPAVATLEDLAVLFSADGPEGVEIKVGERVAAKLGDGKQRVAASVQYEDVRRSFYDDFATEESGRYWWWIQQMFVDPPLIIAEDPDDSTLWAIPYSTAGDGVDFGDPQEVKQQFADPSGKVLARHGEPGKQYRSTAESRPADRQRPKEVKAMDPKEIRKRLGLAEDASEEELNAKLDELTADPEEKPEEKSDEKPDEKPDEAAQTEKVAAESGTVNLDPQAYAELRRNAELGAKAAERQREEDRDRYLGEAVKAGKFPPARLQHWQELYDKDEEGTRTTIDKLATGLIPVEERGTSKTSESTSGSAEYDRSWLTPAERARVAKAEAGEGNNPRVTVEA